MMGARQGMWAALLTVGVLSLGLNLWMNQHQRRERARQWAQAATPCVTQALQDQQQMLGILQKRQWRAADKRAFGDALQRLRDCWRQQSAAASALSEDPFFEPLERLGFWMGQAVQISEDSLRLNPSRDHSVMQEAIHGLAGMRRNQCDAAFAMGQAVLGQLDPGPDAKAQAEAWTALRAARP